MLRRFSAFWTLTLSTEHSFCVLFFVFVQVKHLTRIVLSMTNACVFEKCGTVSLKARHFSSVVLSSHVSAINKDGAPGQGWQNGVIILVLASTHALPLIHFTVRVLAPEGDIAHVGEKDRVIGREDASFVILPISTSFFSFSSKILLI